MSKIELKKPQTVEVSFDGNEYQVRKPTIREGTAYEAAYTAAQSSQEKIDCIFSFLESLGLPKDVSNALDAEGLEMMIKALLPEQKKR